MQLYDYAMNRQRLLHGRRPSLRRTLRGRLLSLLRRPKLLLHSGENGSRLSGGRCQSQ